MNMANLDTLNELAGSFSTEQQVEVAKWFGKPCLKSQNKVFLVLWGKDMVFKLSGEAHAKALALPGARLFDPRGKGQAMKEWVHVDPPDEIVLQDLAQDAYAYAVVQS
jgi:hypothetical protein